MQLEGHNTLTNALFSCKQMLTTSNMHSQTEIIEPVCETLANCAGSSGYSSDGLDSIDQQLHASKKKKKKKLRPTDTTLPCTSFCIRPIFSVFLVFKPCQPAVTGLPRQSPACSNESRNWHGSRLSGNAVTHKAGTVIQVLCNKPKDGIFIISPCCHSLVRMEAVRTQHAIHSFLSTESTCSGVHALCLAGCMLMETVYFSSGNVWNPNLVV